jgi:ribonuclease R
MMKNVQRKVENRLVECIMCKVSGKYGFARTQENETEDIYISNVEKFFLQEGDKVSIKITDYNTSRGEIVKILERKTKFLVGEYFDNEVIPTTMQFPKVFVSKKNSFEASNGDAVVIEITKYPEDGNMEGRIVEIVPANSLNALYIKSLYIKYDLDGKGDFSNLDQELKELPKGVTKEDFATRVDKTHQEIFSIDPEDAKDLDDAVALEKNGENYLLSVHIADVSHYVKEGSLIDEKAAKRGNSIYIPQVCIPMLPEVLSNKICSLKEDALKLALSVDILFDKYGKVLESNVYKSVIKVTKNMTYDAVYNAVEGDFSKISEDYKDYVPKLSLMKELAGILRARRFKSGGLDLELPETKISYKEDMSLIEISKYDKTFSNNMIEEFMLAANMAVAEQFFWSNVPFIFRVHEDPSVEKVEEALCSMGILESLKKDVSSKKIAEIIERNCKNETEKKALSIKILRALKQAAYSEKSNNHFGLGVKYYTHFTSPIRRYSDLFIHRVISEYLKNGLSSEIRMHKFTKQAVVYSMTCSVNEREAKDIERDFEKLYMCLYMADKVGETFEANIENFTNIGIFVRIESNNICGLIHISNLRKYEYDMEDGMIFIPGSKNPLIVGSKLMVQTKQVLISERKIGFEIVSSS